MAEYINLEKLIALKGDSEYMWYDLYDLEDFLADVKKECSADVVEVVHGVWLDNGDKDKNGVPKPFAISCSVCGSSAGTSWMKYCPNCGADMRGETK